MILYTIILVVYSIITCHKNSIINYIIYTLASKFRFSIPFWSVKSGSALVSKTCIQMIELLYCIYAVCIIMQYISLF